MVRRKNEVQIDTKSAMRGGQGDIVLHHIANGAQELNGKGRLFSKFVIQPGDSIGFHIHEKESEAYYILSGQAEYSDNGTMTQVGAGDVLYTPPGEGHSIQNTGQKPLEFIALILYE